MNEGLASFNGILERLSHQLTSVLVSTDYYLRIVSVIITSHYYADAAVQKKQKRSTSMNILKGICRYTITKGQNLNMPIYPELFQLEFFILSLHLWSKIISRSFRYTVSANQSHFPSVTTEHSNHSHYQVSHSFQCSNYKDIKWTFSHKTGLNVLRVSCYPGLNIYIYFFSWTKILLNCN